MKKLAVAAVIVTAALVPSAAYAGYWGPYGYVPTCGWVMNAWGVMVYVCG